MNFRKKEDLMNKNDQSNEQQQKKMLEFHERIAELEKLERPVPKKVVKKPVEGVVQKKVVKRPLEDDEI